MGKKVEEQIALREKKYRTIADKFVDVVWVLDASNFKFLYLSSSTVSLRGFEKEETIGQSIQEIFTPESYLKAIEIFGNATLEFRQGIKKTYKLEAEAYHKNGSTVWLEIMAKLAKEEGDSLKIIGIARNIDKLKSSELEREKLISKLQDALMEKEKLLHEVKMLESLLPICSACKRIRHENNTWWPMEKYIEEHTDSKFTHTICPDCSHIYYGREKQSNS
jgi:PAS domain S-box-containing protein